MARCYAILIRKNLKTIDEIPEEFRDEVQEILERKKKRLELI